MLEDVNEKELEEVKGEGTPEAKDEPKKGIGTWLKKHAAVVAGIGAVVVTATIVVIKALAGNGSPEATEEFGASTEPIVDSNIQSNDVQ